MKATIYVSKIANKLANQAKMFDFDLSFYTKLKKAILLNSKILTLFLI